MSISMYQAAVPTLIRALKNLADVTAKGAQHVEAKKIPPEAILSFRLYPDMLSFTKQIQIASDISKGGCARLAGIEAPAFEDNEASFPELLERIRKTIAFLETIKPEQMDGAETRTITWTTRTSERSLVGLQYIFTHVMPNVFFHSTTAYDILRHNGVEVGKMDFLGKP
jgi:uncharacterized protein